MFDNSPHYKRNNSTKLVDIISDIYGSFIDKLTYNTKISYHSVIDDLDAIKLGKSIDTVVQKTGKLLEKTKNLNNPLFKATCLSVAANIAASYVFKDYNVGYVAESAIYSPAFAYLYWKTNKKLGVSNTRVGIDLLVSGAVSFCISVGPYRHYRNEIINYIIQNNYIDFIQDPNMLRAAAAGITQVLFMPVWAVVLNPIIKGIDYLDNKFKFKNKLVYGTEKVTNGINGIITNNGVKNNKSSTSSKVPPIF
jgi:hypothetical protein